MGIKHFFMWFKNEFSENMYNMRVGEDFSSINLSIDNLMIDMNGVFHNSAQRIYEYGNFKIRPRLLCNRKPYVKPHGLQKQLKLFEDVCKTIEHLFKLTKPKKRLILCVDGPAPLSKQNQQRQRRFRSVMETMNDDVSFNSNCITPGTKFMDYLTKYIDWYIRKRISEDPEWQKIQVIFSNEKAPGEGEHKIINYIRYYGNDKETYCINGLDADLIMLALGTHIPNFYILREDMYDPSNKFFCVDIGTIREKLANKLRWNEQEYKFDMNSAINDFIFLCFMTGNDFLPHIPSIEIIESGIELILEVYKIVGALYGHITTHNISGRVQFLRKPLSVFLEKIGEYEKENFENKLGKKESFFPDPLLNKCSTECNGKWFVDIEKYKKEYFQSCFVKGTIEEKLCHEYLEGMQWVLSYYTRGVPNWKWNFKHHYAPPASTIAKYCLSFQFPRYGRTIPSTPFQQLLCVLPPKSAYLIPSPLSNLLTDNSSPLKEYCPNEFKIDLSGKRKEWEGIVILPTVNFELVRTCYMKMLNKVDPIDMKRNVTGRSFVYEYIPELPSTFRSYYGNIEKCCVRSSMIDL